MVVDAISIPVTSQPTDASPGTKSLEKSTPPIIEKPAEDTYVQTPAPDSGKTFTDLSLKGGSAKYSPAPTIATQKHLEGNIQSLRTQITDKGPNVPKFMSLFQGKSTVAQGLKDLALQDLARADEELKNGNEAQARQHYGDALRKQKALLKGTADSWRAADQNMGSVETIAKPIYYARKGVQEIGDYAKDALNISTQAATVGSGGIAAPTLLASAAVGAAKSAAIDGGIAAGEEGAKWLLLGDEGDADFARVGKDALVGAKNGALDAFTPGGKAGRMAFRAAKEGVSSGIDAVVQGKSWSDTAIDTVAGTTAGTIPDLGNSAKPIKKFAQDQVEKVIRTGTEAAVSSGLRGGNVAKETLASVGGLANPSNWAFPFSENALKESSTSLTDPRDSKIPEYFGCGQGVSRARDQSN